MPAVAALVLYQFGAQRLMGLALIGVAGAMFFAIWRPTPRQLKQSGIIMTVLLALALALVLTP